MACQVPNTVAFLGHQFYIRFHSPSSCLRWSSRGSPGGTASSPPPAAYLPAAGPGFFSPRAHPEERTSYYLWADDSHQWPLCPKCQAWFSNCLISFYSSLCYQCFKVWNWMNHLFLLMASVCICTPQSVRSMSTKFPMFYLFLRSTEVKLIAPHTSLQTVISTLYLSIKYDKLTLSQSFQGTTPLLKNKGKSPKKSFHVFPLPMY